MIVSFGKRNANDNIFTMLAKNGVFVVVSCPAVLLSWCWKHSVSLWKSCHDDQECLTVTAWHLEASAFTTFMV